LTLLNIVDKILEKGAPRGLDEAVVSDFAKKIGADVFETSAVTGHNINDLFYKIARDYLNKKKGGAAPKTYNPEVDLNAKPAAPAAQQGGCCG
jgi:hypothetical protein